LLYVEKQNQEAVIDTLSDLFYLPVKFDDGGSRITYYDQTTVLD